MGRNSVLAKRVTAALTKRGFRGVNGRRLERWCADGLGPHENSEFPQLLAHFAELSTISTSGQDSEVCARRLASRGFLCRRLRGSLLREIGLDEEPESGRPQLISVDGEMSDAAFAELEVMAREVAVNTQGLPPLMIRVVNALRRNAQRRARELGEPEDDLFQRFVLNGLCYLMGADIYDATAVEAALNLKQDEVTPDVLDAVNAVTRISPSELSGAYRSVPIALVVQMAQRITSVGPAVLDYLGVSGTLAEIEDLAAILAPGVAYYVNLVRVALEGAVPEVFQLDELELPALTSAAG